MFLCGLCRQLKQEVNELKDKLQKDGGAARTKMKELSQQIHKLTQIGQREIQAALDQHQVDLRQQQERHESLLLQARGLSGYNLVRDDYHKGMLHVLIIFYIVYFILEVLYTPHTHTHHILVDTFPHTSLCRSSKGCAKIFWIPFLAGTEGLRSVHVARRRPESVQSWLRIPDTV